MNDFLQSLRNGQAEKQRTPKTRKNFDNGYHYTSPSRFQSYGYQGARAPQMKRSSTPQQQPSNQSPMDDSTVTSMLAEAIESLSRHIETLAKNQDYLVAVQERTADLMERQAVAIERIVNHLNIAPTLQTDSDTEDQASRTFENHYVTSQEEQHEAVETAETAETSPEPEKETRSVIRRRRIVTPKVETTENHGTELLSREAVMNIIETMRTEGATYDQVASRLIELGQPTFSGRGEWHAQTIHRLCSKK